MKEMKKMKKEKENIRVFPEAVRLIILPLTHVRIAIGSAVRPSPMPHSMRPLNLRGVSRKREARAVKEK
jgi:hypothetical protein